MGKGSGYLQGVREMDTLGGEAEGFEEDVLVVSKRLYNRIQKLIRHVVLIHFLCPEEVLIVDNQQTRNLF